MSLFDLWDFGDPAASADRFRSAAGAAAGEERALALTQLARTFGLRGRFDEARATLAEADDMLGEGDSPARAQYWIELGRVENSGGHPTEAMPHFERCLEMAQRLGEEYLAVDAVHMLAIAAPGAMQTTYGEKALAMARAAQDERARDWIGPIANNLGWTLVDLGRSAEAIPFFEEAVRFRRDKGVAKPLRIALYSMGYALRAVGRVPEALAIQQEAAAIGVSDGYVEEEIGECLCALGRAEEARPYFRTAHEKLRSSGEDTERLARLAARA